MGVGEMCRTQIRPADPSIERPFFFFAILHSDYTKAENAPACHRDPRWPGPRISTKSTEKIPPGRKSGTPRKYPEKTSLFGILRGIFCSIFGAFWGYILGVQNVGLGGIFFGIFRGNSGSGHLVDERQITHLICARPKYDLYDFFRGVFGP